MKYAFVIGSNAFIVPGSVINYSDHDGDKEFLRINGIYHDGPSAAGSSFLDIDLNITDLTGTPVNMLANKLVNASQYTIKLSRDSVHILRADRSTLIHVHQLDDESAMSLEHNITAELDVHAPVVVIRITGEFLLGDIRVSAENEKLFINDNGYATSAMAGKSHLRFTSAGIIL